MRTGKNPNVAKDGNDGVNNVENKVGHNAKLYNPRDGRRSEGFAEVVAFLWISDKRVALHRGRYTCRTPRGITNRRSRDGEKGFSEGNMRDRRSRSGRFGTAPAVLEEGYEDEEMTSVKRPYFVSI